jgi:hypothetical protein
MGRIKSALELALERTEQVQGDKDSIEQYEAKRLGKKLASEYLEGDEAAPELGTAIKKTASAVRASFMDGLLEVFLARISLPRDEADVKRLDTLGKGLQTVIGNPRFSALWKQFQALAARYLDEEAQYDDAIRRQYEPQLRQKEAELSRRLGQTVRIDPFQDPEFAAFYKKNMDAFKARYDAAVQDAREQVKSFTA